MFMLLPDMCGDLKMIRFENSFQNYLTLNKKSDRMILKK